MTPEHVTREARDRRSRDTHAPNDGASRSRRQTRPGHARPGPHGDTLKVAANAESFAERGAALAIIALLVITPLLVLPGAKESFRLIQGLAAGWLGLASLTIASLGLRDHGRTAHLWGRPAMRALVPLAIVVAIGGLFTAHPIHFRAAFYDFAIGVACLAGWSLALRARTLLRLLLWTIPPAVIVALLGLDQFAGWFGTLDWLNVSAPTERLRITSTVGNPGDLASMLVLPIVIAVSRLAATESSARRERVLLGAALVIMLMAIAVTATIASVAAVAVGVAVWWLLRYAIGVNASSSSPASSSHQRRAWTMPVAIVGIIAMLAAGAVTISAPLRSRVMEKATQLAQGDINAMLTGRLDGWRAAWAMLQRAPATGVGQGAFRAEFAETRLALTAQGVPYYAQQIQTLMATPHNEALSVAAEQGVPGLIALAWAVWCLAAAAARRDAPPPDASLTGATKAMRDAGADPRGQASASRPLAWGGIAALAVLSVVSFPLHVPAVAWPWLLFLSWVFRQSEEEVAA